MNIRDFLWDLFPHFYKKFDTYKNTLGQGFLERYIRAFGFEVDQEVMKYLTEVTELKYNKAYGILYNHYVSDRIVNPNNEGDWDLPTLSQVTELYNHLGGINLAGGKLKSRRTEPLEHPRFNSPNIGATDEYGFNSLPGGYRHQQGGMFFHKGMFEYLWCKDTVPTNNAYYWGTIYNEPRAISGFINRHRGNTIRLMRLYSAPIDGGIVSGQYSPVDYLGNDGKAYKVVRIGNQMWITESLLETRFNDGELIPILQSDSDWLSDTDGAMCYYDNDINNSIRVVDDYFLNNIEAGKVNDNLLKHLAKTLGSPPEFLDDLNQRKLLQYIVNLYKIKGTKLAYEFFINLLGFDIDIYEYEPTAGGLITGETVRYDMDPPLLYDQFMYDGKVGEMGSVCIPCSDYDILLKLKPIPGQVEKTGYGALYNWYVTQEGELIEGFDVPQSGDYQNMALYIADALGLTGTVNQRVSQATKYLYSVRVQPDAEPRWDTVAFLGQDDYNFSLLPSGMRPSEYININQESYLWFSNEDSGNGLHLASGDLFSLIFGNFKGDGMSIRLVRPLTTAEQSLADGTFLQPVQDYDGNWYEVVKIGDLAWTAQNLRTTHFADGTPIANVTDNTDWANATDAAMCYYNNDPGIDGIVYTDETIEILIPGTQLNPEIIEILKKVIYFIEPINAILRHITLLLEPFTDNVEFNVNETTEVSIITQYRYDMDPPLLYDDGWNYDEADEIINHNI
jgi:uncharacterized protein (TIGR02145 family)